ncbi:MAG TPA: hypothetical protein VFV68_09600 [Agriterribacter sp.]|nr:hypothetical protein [Agriterribacter sp.]
MKTLRTKIRKVTSTPKGKIIGAVIMLVMVVGVSLGIFYWNAIKRQFIRRQVATNVQEKTDRLYHIDYDNMELDEVAGNLSVSNLRLAYDSSRYFALRETGDEPSMLFTVEIPSIQITGVQTPKALLTKEIVAGKLRVDHPVIEILYTQEGKDSSKRVPPNEVYKQILGELQMIKMDTLLITGAQIITRVMQSGKQKLEILDAHLELRQVLIDSTSNLDSSRMLFAKHLDVFCAKMEWTSANQLYNYSIEEVEMHSDQEQIKVGSFKVIPTLGEEKFTAKVGIQADRYDLDFRDIRLQSINFPQLLNERIMADSVILQASVKIYRDMTLPEDKRSKIGTYPHQKLVQIPLPLEIKKLILKNTFIEYKEHSPVTQKIGKVTFDQVNATFDNVTNIKAATASVMTADIHALFLKKTPVHTLWRFYLFNPKGRFDIKGELKAMDATEINSLTEPLGGVRAEKGRINDLRFNFKGQDYGMDGTVKFLYNDLKIALLKKEEDKKALQEKKLASWGANMIIKNDNPSRKEKPRIANVHFDRVTNRSIFHLSWKTLFEGVKKTALP